MFGDDCIVYFIELYEKFLVKSSTLVLELKKEFLFNFHPESWKIQV